MKQLDSIKIMLTDWKDQIQHDNDNEIHVEKLLQL